MRRFITIAALALVGAIGTAHDLAAQTPPGGEKPAQPPARPAAAGDDAGKALGTRTDQLAAEAARLVGEYRKAMEAKVNRLAEQDPTLKRLRSAGIFTIDGLVNPPSDPLAALPEMRRAYETLEKTAEDYILQYGGKARESAEKAAADYMRKVIAAQQRFHEEDLDGNTIPDYCLSFFDLAKLGLLDIPKTMKKDDTTMLVEGYKFRIISADTLQWSADAAPAKPEQSSVWLFADERGEVRGETGKPAGAKSPVLK